MILSNNKTLKISLCILAGSLILTGCSSKKAKPNINEVYEYNPSPKIKNSKAMHRATLRPYTVFGKRYYPELGAMGKSYYGIASWYGPNFHAKKTSNGETYNMYAMTAAHKTLPMNTMVRVDNLENGKSTIVRINDRGPFVDGRIIDMSNKAAHAIDMVRKGTVKVKVTIVGYNGIIDDANAPYNQITKYVKPKSVIKKPVVVKEKVTIETLEPFKIKEKSFVQDNYSLQVGAFGKLDGAVKTQNKYQAISKTEVKVKKSGSLYKVLIPGFATKADAEKYKYKHDLKAIIIRTVK